VDDRLLFNLCFEGVVGWVEARLQYLASEFCDEAERGTETANAVAMCRMIECSASWLTRMTPSEALSLLVERAGDHPFPASWLRNELSPWDRPQLMAQLASTVGCAQATA
jgi:hypothetical protein